MTTKTRLIIENQWSVYSLIFWADWNQCCFATLFASESWIVSGEIQAQFALCNVESHCAKNVQIRENTDQKKLRIWTLFEQWLFQIHVFLSYRRVFSELFLMLFDSEGSLASICILGIFLSMLDLEVLLRLILFCYTFFSFFLKRI